MEVRIEEDYYFIDYMCYSFAFTFSFGIRER